MARRASELGYDVGEVFADFGLVLVDEGHYEPAPDWSRAIRSLRRPTVLLTATPYRNDEKYFRFGDEWRYRFTHHEAEAQRFVRTPVFESAEDADPDRFAEALVAFVRAKFGDGTEARTIIRCKDSGGILAMVRALERAAIASIAAREQILSKG
jgi:superfamily II DNA or RNA helicase